MESQLFFVQAISASVCVAPLIFELTRVSCVSHALMHAVGTHPRYFPGDYPADCFDISFWSGMGIGDESGRVQRPRSGMKEWYLISFYFCRVFDCLIILLYKHLSGLTASHRLCQCDAEYSAEQRMGTFQIPRASRTSRSPRSRAGAARMTARTKLLAFGNR